MTAATQQPQRIPCPHCQAQIKAPAVASGSMLNCPRCGQAFALQGAETKPAPAAATRKPAATSSATPVSQPSPPARPSPANPPAAPAVKKPAPVAPPLEFAVVCPLCGSRMYAAERQIGSHIKCQDCHSLIAVNAPATKAKATKGPSLEGVEDVALSDPGERPRYQPMVRATGENAILGLLNNPPFDPSAGVPVDPPVAGPAGGPRPRAPARAAPAAKRPASVPPPEAFPPIGRDPQPSPETDYAESLWPDEPRRPATGSASPGAQCSPSEPTDADDSDDDFQLSAPVERPVVKVELPHHIAADLPDPRDSGSWGDELWEGSGNDGRPRWQQSPFLVGVFEFLFYPATIGHWIVHILALSALLTLAHYAVEFSGQGPMQVGSLICTMMLVVFGFLWLATFSRACLGIVQDTANGQEVVEDWPDWLFLDWIGAAFYMPIGAFMASLPGLVFASAMFWSGAPAIALPLPILVSLLALFPIVLCSMLIENSILTPYSPSVPRMLRTAGEGWMVFYMLSFVIGLLTMLSLGLWEFGGVVALVCSAAALVTLALLYMRLLGRLLWLSQKRLTEEDNREARLGATPAARRGD